MPVFETSQSVALDVDVAAGHVEIVGEDRSDVIAEVAPSNEGRSGDRSLAEAATIEHDGDRVVVRVPRRMNLFGRNDSVDVRVAMPRGSHVEVRSAYGSVQLRGVLGSTRVDAKYGTVSIDAVGDLVLSAPHGEVDVREVGGRLDLDAGHSRVRVGAVRGEAHLRAAHGSIDLGVAHGPVVARLSGALRIETALSDVSAQSAYGALRVDAATTGTVRLDNGYGDIEVGVPAGTAAWVDASSAHGTVRNELTAGAAAGGTERTVELHLSSEWADVVVRRSRAFS